jgi:branched-chain amino acid transport system ATP-binding protein
MSTFSCFGNDATFLHTDSLRKEFGGVIAVADVDFCVKKDSITGLIGPNGAGKTTLFNNITGLDVPTEGCVFFMGADITSLPAHKITRLGIARTFQNIRLFNEMTVLENVMIGRHFKGIRSPIKKLKIFSNIVEFFSLKKEERDIFESSMKWLEFFKLTDVADKPARNLPYGKQRTLEIARALATEPKLLFLDEPAAGMNAQETAELVETIRSIRNMGITVVLIEHDMKLVMNVCDTITVLNYGRKIAEGTPSEIQNNHDVIEAYLGRSE